jgi:ankyrin repeat protein
MGEVEVARLLISHGADVNASTKDGRTPLSQARMYTGQKHQEIAEMLIAHGAKE